MAIIIKGKSTKDQTKTAKSLRNLRDGDAPVKLESVPATKNYIQKLVQQAAAKKDEQASTINNGIIKPKYIQDKSVGYKKSGYIKDLLGEES